MKNSNRLKIFQIAVILMAAAIILRLIYWQFVAKVEGNSNNYQSNNQLPAERGEIRASDGFSLVTNQEAYLLFAKPYDIRDSPQNIAKELAPLLISEKYATNSASLKEEEKNQKEQEIKKKEEELTKGLSNKNLFWVQLARKIPKELKEKIQKKEIFGSGFERDTKRFYPEASMAAHTLGFVASDEFGQDKGYFGLEGYYNRYLEGKPGRLGQELDPFGLPILVGKYRPISPQKGSSLQLTLERTVQFIIEAKLQKAVEKYGAKSGLVIVSDPKTGGILASASYPGFDPNLYSEYEQTSFKNPAISDTYEPGSTFKLITMAAALDSQEVEPQTRCSQCQGPRKIANFEITTWNKQYYPNSTMEEVIEHSDNIGMIFAAEKLGIDKFYSYIKKFGLGQKTGIDLQGESSGNLRPGKDWTLIDLATASFGQGLAVTPIQMVQAVSAIANQGKLTTPHIVDKIIDSGKEVRPEHQQPRPIISEKTANQITEMMVNAVKKGEAKAFAPKNYRIAGKTGTAQIPVAGHYDPDKTIASFIGFAPADDPKFLMLVLLNEPSASPFGSETAAPTFFEIAKELFKYYGIPPSG